MRWLPVTLLATRLLSYSHEAAAQEAMTRGAAATRAPAAIIVAPLDAPISDRLLREMDQAGLLVTLGPLEPAVHSSPLVIIVPEDPGGAIEIWAISKQSRKLVASVRPEETDDTLVLRVTELARALSINAAVPATRTTPPKARPRGHTKPPPRLPETIAGFVVDPRPAEELPSDFDVGVAGGIGLQSAGISMQIEGSASYWPHALLGVTAFASAPAVGAEITRPEGTATSRSALFALEFATSPTGRTGTFSLMLDPGVGLSYLHVSGSSDLDPSLSAEGAALSFAAYGRGEVRARIAGPLRARLSLLAGAAVPPIDIRFAGRVVSTFSPIGCLSLGITLEP